MPDIDKPKMSDSPEMQFFSVNEAALVLGVSRKAIQDWIETGVLPAFQLGTDEQLVRIRRQDLERFFREHGDLVENARRRR